MGTGVVTMAVLLAACGSAAIEGPRERGDAAVAFATELANEQTKASWMRAVVAREVAMVAYAEAGELGKQADVAGEIGALWDNLGDMRLARAWSERSLELYRAAGDKHGEAMALSWVGIAEVHLDRAHDAIQHFEAAREIAKHSGADDAYAYALLNIGYARNVLQDWREAEEAIELALPIFEKVKDRVSVATCHNNLGHQREQLGDAAGALAHHEQALAIRVADDHQLDVAWSQLSIASVYLDLLGDADAALARFQIAHDIWVKLGNDVGIPIARLGIARTRAARGDAGAIADFDAAITGYRAVHAERGVTEASVGRAEFLGRLGKPGARDALAAALALAETSELPTYQIRALVGLARLDLASGDLVKARTELERSIALVEGLRAKVVREEHRRSFFATVQASFELRVAVAIAEGDLGAAFVTSERARARTLVEALAGGELAKARGPVDATATAALLDDTTVLASYVLGEDRSYAFVIAAATPIRVVELPGRAAIAEVTRPWLDAIRTPGSRDTANSVAKLLVDPLGITARRIVIVPDGVLHFVPFAELLRGREVVNLPSATALAELRDRPIVDQHAVELAILADPIFASDDPRVRSPRPPSTTTPARLRFSRHEADAIAALTPRALVATDASASIATVRGASIADARIVHFATHAFVDTERPERSGIGLSQVTADGTELDGTLRLPDIEKLRWKAELVVISGCRSALGPEVRGEGMVGLVGGFLRAGARRVVASLWEVDDRATSELMIRFHHNVATQPAATALANARRSIAAEPAWRDPYYWAGFALYGDWR